MLSTFGMERDVVASLDWTKAMSTMMIAKKFLAKTQGKRSGEGGGTHHKRSVSGASGVEGGGSVMSSVSQ